MGYGVKVATCTALWCFSKIPRNLHAELMENSTSPGSKEEPPPHLSNIAFQWDFSYLPISSCFPSISYPLSYYVYSIDCFLTDYKMSFLYINCFSPLACKWHFCVYFAHCYIPNPRLMPGLLRVLYQYCSMTYK